MFPDGWLWDDNKTVIYRVERRVLYLAFNA